MPNKKSSSPQASSSEQTRQKLLDAGLQLFADHGFEGVSTRTLAKAAGVNQAAILYHFQSKEGLYLDVIRKVVATVKPGLEPLVQDVRGHLLKGSSKKQAREDIQAIVAGLLHEVLIRSAGSDDDCNIGPIMLREQLKPSGAFDILYQELLEPLHVLLCELVATVRGGKADDTDVIIEVQSLFGQAIIFGAHRATLLRRLGRTALDERGMEEIIAVIRTSLVRQLA